MTGGSDRSQLTGGSDRSQLTGGSDRSQLTGGSVCSSQLTGEDNTGDTTGAADSRTLTTNTTPEGTCEDQTGPGELSPEPPGTLFYYTHYLCLVVVLEVTANISDLPPQRRRRKQVS